MKHIVFFTLFVLVALAACQPDLRKKGEHSDEHTHFEGDGHHHHHGHDDSTQETYTVDADTVKTKSASPR